MPKAAYHLTHPQRRTTAVVFSSPHSGRDYPWSFLRRTNLNDHTVRSSEDAFVDQLFQDAPRYGAPFIKAGAPRAYVDLNRSEEELDPALIEGVRKSGHNPRIASGLGVIPRVVANGQAIYTGKITMAEAERRIDTYWRPYHEALSAQLDQAHLMFGQAILIDCHSMPHEAMDTIARTGIRRPEVVLGDRFGAAAAPGIVDRIEEVFTSAGLVVTRNTPFAGAYVTQRYGRPSRNRHAVQIEIDRALYMNEQLIRPNGHFEAFRNVLNGVIAEIAAIGRPAHQALAAE
ncbi:N-formylglutamate deformylase [Roseovarius pacificus]|uniref:N-formylglutamate deformylase n=1 Tax=Roseovarius pacificus TaxID=337701 RepID=A0A1M7BYZ3_9RHOB|nr:N-formylglutamate amidohydrolase [Roseovarius pacificus]GGO56007.1 N-formylglutamate amidohydrolase [Roseovarius pacificus]SHL60278.1 N-formylglutamate deformylase [Roseovarius pacificus]